MRQVCCAAAVAQTAGVTLQLLNGIAGIYCWELKEEYGPVEAYEGLASNLRDRIMTYYQRSRLRQGILGGSLIAQLLLWCSIQTAG